METDNSILTQNLKLGIIKELHARGLITREQMEAAIDLLRKKEPR